MSAAQKINQWAPHFVKDHDFIAPLPEAGLKDAAYKSISAGNRDGLLTQRSFRPENARSLIDWPATAHLEILPAEL